MIPVGQIPATPLTTKARLLAARIDGGVEATPSGPGIPPIVPRSSSFGGFPSQPTAAVPDSPSATYARFSLGA